MVTAVIATTAPSRRVIARGNNKHTRSDAGEARPRHTTTTTTTFPPLNEWRGCFFSVNLQKSYFNRAK
jgi:hypothetical protein